MYVVQSLGEDWVSVIDYGGSVEKFSPDTIKIAGVYYMRNQFEFRVDKKRPANLNWSAGLLLDTEYGNIE